MVSVIIPVFNTAEYVERCIKSVICQTYKDIEIIIVDDGSTDKSLDICKGLRQKDERIIITSQSNAGASMARNLGLDMAKGDYIMFVDSDDWIDCNMIETLLDSILTTGVDVVISQIPGKVYPILSDKVLNGREILLYVLRDLLWWAPYGKLFKLNCFKSLRFAPPTLSEDYRLMTELMLRNPYVGILSQSLYHRTIRSDSLTSQVLNHRKFEEIDNVLEVCEIVKTAIPEYAKYAERNLADSLLMLLLQIEAQRDNSITFDVQKKRIQSLIFSHYWGFLRNSAIPFKQKLLLSGCFSQRTSRLITRLYHNLRK